MAAPTNILQAVQTYQRSRLGFMQNMNCFIGEIANTRFKEFNDIRYNLGSTVTFDLAPRTVANDGLVVTFNPQAQRVQSLVVSQAKNSGMAFTAQDLIFNVAKAGEENYEEIFKDSAIKELGTAIEIDLAAHCNSSSLNMQTQTFNTASGPFRFYGDGVNQINSYGQLQRAIVNFKTFGALKTGIKVVLPDVSIPSIVSNGMQQFAPERNNKNAADWKIVDFAGVSYYTSNLLPIQNAGTVGNSNQLLTVVSTNDPTGAAITSITFSGATNNDQNAIKAGDLIQFVDNVSGQPNLRFLTFVGHAQSFLPVQCRATANVAANGSGQVTIPINAGSNGLCAQAQNGNQNINNNIVAGMQARVLPSHVCGLVLSDDAFFLAMPRIPEEDPFPSSNEMDEDTKCSLFCSYGSTWGQNQRGLYVAATWGATLVPENCMRIAFPLNIT